MIPTVVRAIVLGIISALPLVAGAWYALERRPSDRTVGMIAAFGAGALISAVSYELVLDAVEHGSEIGLPVALASGAIAYWAGSRYLDKRVASGGGSARGLALMLGAALDGIPESFILGISVAAGGGVSLPFLVAIIVSNLPEGMASAADLAKDPDISTRRILLMWCGVVALSGIMAGLGAIVVGLGGITGAAAQAFAAGALLTMLIDDLIPEAEERAGAGAGLVGVLGFAVAFMLHQMGA